ncbi:glycosyltransferase [Halorubrum salsamenti]|uniref:glycosyltransferase n=1 Tax=Halorubrum salsamenti TaxID=2583990 RepID=UPI0011A382FE|nr:glycosyltransferase [Halorubrum salsamenti]
MNTVLYVAMLITPEIEGTYNIDSYSQAGYHKISNIIDSLVANNKQVTVISPLSVTESSLIHRSPKKYTHPDNGVTIIVPRLLNVYEFSVINKLFLIIFTTGEVIKQIISDKIFMILFYNMVPSKAIPATIGSLISNTPLILEYEDGSFANRSIVGRLAIKSSRIISAPWVDGAICVNALLAKRAPTKNTIIFRGFPSVGLPEDLPTVEYDESKTVVMYAGKFDRLRGVHTYINMIEEYRGEKCEFWISGWGPEEEINKIEKEINLINNDDVTFFGQLPFSEYKRCCVQADVLINPQDPDNLLSKYTFPSKILDFLSSETIIITTDMADLKSEMSDVLIIDGKSPESLSKTLDHALKMDENSINRQKNNGQQWIRDHCDHKKIGQDIIRLGSS